MVRRPDGPRQKTICDLGELNSSAEARWLKKVEVFNDEGEAHQLKVWSNVHAVTEAEAFFRSLKSELSIRPLFRQLEPRVKGSRHGRVPRETHVLEHFHNYCTP